MIIFDLDMTLANCEHRRHFVDSSKLGTKEDYEKWLNPFLDTKTCPKWKPDWKSFFESCDKDTVIQPTLQLLRYYLLHDEDVQIWSGRCESVRTKTENWLDDECDMYSYVNLDVYSDYKHLLKMRPIGDSTPDDKLK